jgi:hypothetical protein
VCGCGLSFQRYFSGADVAGDDEAGVGRMPFLGIAKFEEELELR